MKTKIALLQMNSSLKPDKNLLDISNAAKEARRSSTQYLFLPECFLSISNGLTPTPYQVELEDDLYKSVQSIAKENDICLLGGSVSFREKEKIYNRTLNFSSKGEELSPYYKMHLFRCDFSKNGKRKKINEGLLFNPGTTPSILELNELRIGLGICFDIRYSEMARAYVKQGANCLTFSSAFTVPTGKAHWEILVRARAIENQVYSIACAQWGKHHENIHTYGHSMVVDPWGDIVLNLKEGEKLGYAELDFDYLNEVRSKVIMS